MQQKLNIFSFLFSVISFVFIQLFGFVWVLPYIVKSLFFPDKKRLGRKKRLNLKLRRILEFKHARQAMGINIAILLLLFSFFQVPTGIQAQATGEVESKIVADLDSILTEKTYQVPVIGYISQYFTSFHNGIDYAGNYLASIYPTAEGSVISVEYGYLGYGNNVLVDHGNGLISRYAHLHTVSVEVGQNVDKNTQIGLVGSTGWSTGPHLHFETIYKGEKINPLSLME